MSPVHSALAGIVVAFVVTGLFQALTIPAFAPRDEPRHVAYAVELTKGRLPTVLDTVPFSNVGTEPVHGSHRITAANHPPLYYLIVAAALRVEGGVDESHLAAGIELARVLTLLITATGLVLAFRALRRIDPDRPEIALAAIACVAATPGFVNCASIVMNDGLAFFAAAGLFEAAFEVLFEGPSRKRCAFFAIWLAVSGLTRFAALLIAPAAIAAFGVGHLLHGKGKARDRVVRAAAEIGVALAALVVCSGYFYYRNQVLYDDMTGAKALVKELHRRPHAAFIHQLVDPEVWRKLLDELWTELAGHVMLPGFELAGRAVFAVGVVGLGKWLVERRRDGLLALRRPENLARMALAGGFICVTLPILAFVEKGGGLSPRYYFPMLWALWYFIAFGLSSIARALPSAAAIVLMAWWLVELNTYLAHFFLSRSSGLPLQRAFEGAHVPAGTLSLGVLLALLAAGSMLFVTRVTALSRAESAAEHEQ